MENESGFSPSGGHCTGKQRGVESEGDSPPSDSQCFGEQRRGGKAKVILSPPMVNVPESSDGEKAKVFAPGALDGGEKSPPQN